MEEIRISAKEYVDGEVAHLRDLMQAWQDGLNAKIDGAVEGLNAKMDGMSAKMDGMSAKMDGMSAKMDAVLALCQPLFKEVMRLRQDVDLMKDMLSGKELRGFKVQELSAGDAPPYQAG